MSLAGDQQEGTVTTESLQHRQHHELAQRLRHEVGDVFDVKNVEVVQVLRPEFYVQGWRLNPTLRLQSET